MRTDLLILEAELGGGRHKTALWRSGCCPIALTPMSKKTKKRKARMRRSKANHGKRPNMGRG